MPEINGIGFSGYTDAKHDDYRYLLEIQIPIVGSIIARSNWAWDGYLHFDITAGDGGTPVQPGSPIIFASIVQKHNLKYKAVLIEQRECNAESLRQKFSDDSRIIVEHGDHGDILPRYIDHCPVGSGPRKVYGSLFVDPTGCEPPWGLLAQFSQSYKYTDIIIYLAATNIKRIRGSFAALQIEDDHPTLLQRLGSIGKTHWLVREHQGPHQWTFLIGTNWLNYPDWKPRGFYSVKSPEGQRVLRELNYTAEERKQQDRTDQLELPLP